MQLKIERLNKKHKFEIWCQLHLTDESQYQIRQFFEKIFYIDPKKIIHNMHLTVYHSRRPMFDLNEKIENCDLTLDTNFTRFMVMAPGGENPRPELIPAERKIGIRVQKRSKFRNCIDEYRKSILEYEDEKVLGLRKPSNRIRNAFGSRHFQPHITFLRAGSDICTDLTKVGEEFREYIHYLHFDKFEVKRTRTNYLK